MASVSILGRDVPVEFLVGDNATEAMDVDALLAGLDEVAERISGVADWSDEERRAFRGMRGIIFFEGEVEVNGWKLTRPGCDEDDALFYWEANEFMRNTDPGVRANTFFHDCWHVVQFLEKGDFARSEQERVDREVDAIARQIEVARKLGCRDDDIAFLERFRGDQATILARLLEGVRVPHANIGQA